MLLTLIRKNLLQRPLRYVLTGLSITFGVAAVTAVFMFTDGLRDTFGDLSADIESGFDIAVQSDVPFGDVSLVPPVPLDLVDPLAEIEGVQAVQPRVIEFGVIPVDDDGEALLAQGPNIGVNWESRTPNPRLFVDEGREPRGPGEFAVDVDGFADGNFTVGESYRVLSPSGSAELELVGTFTFASAEGNALVGAILLAFEEQQAVELLNGGEGYDDIVLVVDGESADVIPDVEAVLANAGDTLVAVDQQERIDDQEEVFGQFLTIFQTVLLVFAVIILIVSAFLIFNVFTITLGQRIRELGLLRSIGAFGSQVTSMMLGEALILGAVATVVGIPSGMALARLLRWGLAQFDFPGDTGLPLRPLTIVVALLVGVVITVLAALLPSLRARSVTPMAALRDSGGGEVLDVSHAPSVVRLTLGAASTIALFAAIALGTGSWIVMLFVPLLAATLLYLLVRSLGDGWGGIAKFALLGVGVVLLAVVRFASLDLAPTFGLLGSGALITIVGASQVSGLVASPASRALGYPIPLALIVGLVGIAAGGGAIAAFFGGIAVLIGGNAWGVGLMIVAPIAAMLGYGLVRTARGAFGLTGRLARDNAARNPTRTASTATALMIGLTLVAGVTVVGDSIKASVSDALGSSIAADWLITGPSSGPGGVPFSTEAADLVDELDEVDTIVPYRFSFSGFVSLQGVTADEVQQRIPELFGALGERDDAPQVLEALEAELGVTDLAVRDVLAADYATVLDHIDPEFVERDSTIDPGRSIWLEDGEAEDTGLAVGDSFVALFVDGQAVDVTVAGIYEDGFVFGDRVIDNSLWEQHLPGDTHAFISATTAPGVDAEAARAALTGALEADYPILDVQDRDEFRAEQESQINQTLAVVNVLLLLSFLIAVMGIAIALALAVFERTREIGLLRAVGTTRQQTRWMVRWEGVIVAAFGGLVGVIVGVGIGVLATQKLPEFIVTTTSFPIGTLLLYVVVSALTGIGAGAFPAWIAGRMNVLDAIANE